MHPDHQASAMREEISLCVFVCVGASFYPVVFSIRLTLSDPVLRLLQSHPRHDRGCKATFSVTKAKRNTSS